MELPNLPKPSILEPKPQLINRRRRRGLANKRNWRKISLVSGLGIFIFLFVSYLLIVGINKFFNKHYFQFNQVLAVQIKPPFEIKDRTVDVPEAVTIIQEIEIPDEAKTPVEKYICEKWGVYDCKLAIAVAKAEGLEYDENGEVIPDLVGINGDRSIDVGIFQINSVHFEQEGCSLKEIVDPYKNIDCAYGIYEASGWSPWVTFQNGSYIKHYDNK